MMNKRYISEHVNMGFAKILLLSLMKKSHHKLQLLGDAYTEFNI